MFMHSNLVRVDSSRSYTLVDSLSVMMNSEFCFILYYEAISDVKKPKSMIFGNGCALSLLSMCNRALVSSFDEQAPIILMTSGGDS